MSFSKILKNGKFLNSLLIFLCIYVIFLFSKETKKEIRNYKHIINLSKNFRTDFTVDTTATLPYVSGSTLILYSDYIYDDHVKNVDQSIEQMKPGDVILVKIDLIDEFFTKIFIKLTKPFILITHQGDYSTDIKHAKYLNDSKLLVWFGQNPAFTHPKFIPMPIGFENTFWHPEKINFIRKVKTNELIPWHERKYLLYLNFNSGTNPGSREYLNNFLKNFPNVLISGRVNYATYLKHLENSKYVLCPRGHGLDTHRFYETVLMGSIPVVENSTLYPIQKETSVLVLNSFRNLTTKILENPQKYVNNLKFSKEILFMDYWWKKVEKIRKDF